MAFLAIDGDADEEDKAPAFQASVYLRSFAESKTTD